MRQSSWSRTAEKIFKKKKKENNHSYPNLFFLPGGTPVDDGSHLLSSNRMQELIDYTKVYNLKAKVLAELFENINKH